MNVSESTTRVDYDPFGSSDRPRRPKVTSSKKKRSLLLRWTRRTFGLAVGAILPFLLLVRLSVFLYSEAGWGSWSALLGAGFATAVLLALYVWLFRVRLQGRLTVPKAALRWIAFVVVAYLIYALVYLSSAQAKTAEVRSGFRDLHPVMRIAVSTILLADRGALVTDLGRTEADYRAWGLPVNEATLHFDQADGWVHAMDLRTVGRPEWRNRLVHFYFWATGFRTLRHMGTADHLHVSLPLP